MRLEKGFMGTDRLGQDSTSSQDPSLDLPLTRMKRRSESLRREHQASPEKRK